MDVFEWWFIAGGLGMLFFMLITRSIKQPLKWMGYGCIYSALGAFVIFLVNIIGEWMHISIPLNFFTASVVGWLRIPGLIYLLAVQIFLIGL